MKTGVIEWNSENAAMIAEFEVTEDYLRFDVATRLTLEFIEDRNRSDQRRDFPSRGLSLLSGAL